MRRLLIIDSSVSSKSPAMRGWLAAAKKILPQRFQEVEVWSFTCELEEEWVKWKKIHPVSGRWAIQSIFYERAVRRMITRLSPDYLAETLIQCTGTHLVQTDIRFIHFWNTAYAEAAAERPDSLKLSVLQKAVGNLIIREERKALVPGNSGEWWCVSRGIAAPILRDSSDNIVVRYLPNSYNPERFNHSVRIRHRDEMRKSLGFADDEIVLAFSAFGHFERKGLRQAAQAVAELRTRGHSVRMLILGGRSSAIQSFRSAMNRKGIDIAGLHFAGLVNEMERYLSAADAFFMPSHFEAFSLAEIEASALGLRLYLTAHPGHEMILREGVNGRLLPWNPPTMAKVLEEEILCGVIGRTHYEMGEALTAETYASTLAAHYDSAIARKWKD